MWVENGKAWIESDKTILALQDAIQAHNAYTDEEAVRLVKELEDAIRLRLACEEVLPMPMMSYSIVDGRACFRVVGLFEADLTLSGSAIEDRWWLLRVKFDFKVTGVGVDRFPRQPKKNQRLQLLAMADSELAPRSVAAVPERSTAVVDEIGNDTDKPGRGPEERNEDVEMRELVPLDEGEVLVRKDAPLVRLYNLLQSQALQYRLDILHYQALQQVKLSWGRRLSVRMEVWHSIRTLHIAYWHRPESDSVSDADEWRPTASASLAISVLEKVQEGGTERVLKQLSTLAERDTSEHGRGQIPERLEVQVRWSMQRPANEYIGSTEIVINADDLNAEALLLDVTSRHGEAAVRAIKARIVSSSLGRLMVIQDCTQHSAKGFPEHYLLLNLSDKVAVALHIDQLSGQIRLVDAVASADGRSSSSLAAHDWLKRLREASTRINERPDQIVPILHILRNKVVLEDLEEKSALLGIPVTTRMPLRQVDYAKLHAKPGTLLYIALVQCPGYYLVVHVGEETIRVALMCAGTFLEDLITSMRIVSLEWLDWQRVVALATSSSSTLLTLGKRKRGGEEVDGLVAITQESLSKLYSYSVALIYYHKIEEQLRASGLAFVHVGGSTALQGPPTLEDSTGDLVSAIVPSLCLDSRTFLDASNRTIINRNVSIRLNDWWDPAKAHVAFSLRLQLKEGLVTRHDILETAQQRINFDPDTGVLDFFIRDIDNCLAVFLTIWKRMERMLELAREMLSGQASLIFTIDEFDFINVRFSYAKGMMGQVQWVQDLTERKGGHYDLKLEAAGGLSNPLRVLQPTLAAWLNHQDDSSPVFWRKFLEVSPRWAGMEAKLNESRLQIWRQMLPILEHVHAFPDQCCDDADCPELIIQQPSRVRLVFLRKYMLDIQLVRDNKILFRDGVSDASACNSLAKVKDDFTLDDDETTATAAIQSHGDSIPSLPIILSDLLAEYKLAQEKASESEGTQANPPNILIFSNGFLCPNFPPAIDWFLPRLIKRIQDAVQ